MRICVISDIHGNANALTAVLGAIEADAPEAIWCLGDTVGYGPRPNDCCAAVARAASVSLCGNHDLGVLGEISLGAFSDDAATSARWTREVLAPEARQFLEQLAPQASETEAGAELFHGSPRDPVWEYVLSGEAADAALRDTTAPLILVGHSHIPLAVSRRGASLDGGLAPGGTRIDLREARWVLNPGSVGQPRDGDPRAAYLLLDLERRFAEFRRVTYSIGKTQAEMRQLGLPEPLAARLAHGE